MLGNLVAKTFAERGHNIALLDKDQVKLDSLVSDLNLPADRLYAQTIDLLNGPAVHDSAEAVHSKFGGVHGLGGDGDPPGEDDEPDEQQERGEADRGLERG